VDTLTVKTVEFGMLKIHAHCIGILCIHQNWFLMHNVSKTNEQCEHCSLKRLVEGTFSTLFMMFVVFLKNY